MAETDDVPRATPASPKSSALPQEEAVVSLPAEPGAGPHAPDPGADPSASFHSSEHTGETQFLQARSGPIGSPATDIPDLDALDLTAEPHTLDTDGIPHSRRGRTMRRLFTRGLPALALVAIIVWSARELSGISRNRTGTKLDAVAEAQSPAPEDPRVTLESEDEPLRGRDLKLGAAEVERIVPPEALEHLQLRAMLRSDNVAIVNLWATWCAPCKKELPEFKALFTANAATWGEVVRFVPVLVEDSKDAVWVFQHFAQEMPPTSTFLIDQPVGGIKASLIAGGLLTPETESTLPVTMLLDCKQQVRWQRVGALNTASFVELREQVEVVRAEIGTKYCKPTRKRKVARIATTPESPRAAPPVAPPAAVEPTPPAVETHPPAAAPAASTQTLKASCGDGKCSPKLEDCNCADCTCKQGLVCTPKTGGGHFCKEDLL